ncbi:MAG: SRPBCC domain-containing protein [Ferruginibacter sp.]
MDNQPLEFEHTYNAPIKRVWDAITQKEEMKKWYFDIAEFKPEVGFEFEFTAGDEKKKFRHLCKVTEVIPGKKLTYSWRYDGVPGNSFVTFELFEEADKTRLKLTHAGLETFPSDTTDFAKENFIKGWTHIIHTGLKKYLEG